MNACWIAPKHAESQKNYYFRTRKHFTLENQPEKIPALTVAAESYYELTVNGIFVGRGPARGTHTVNYYDSWDVTKFLHQGANEILLLVQCMNEDDFVTAPAQPAMMAELPGIVATGADWEVQPATEWRQDVNTYSVQVGFMEWRDYRRQPVDWQQATVMNGDNPVCRKKLLPRDVPQLHETVYYPVDIPVIAATPTLTDEHDRNIHKTFTYEEHRPLQLNTLALLQSEGDAWILKPLPDHGGVAIVFNFDREIVGRFELELTAPAGTIVDVGHDEELWQNRIKTDHSQDSYTFTDRYILDGVRRKIGNTLHARGFRMVQVVIRNLTEPALIHGVKAIDARYPVVPKGAFHCNDLLLNRIWNVGVETLSACMTDVYTDCPWRERSFWVNDLIVENRTGLQAFGDARINARAFRMAASDVFPDGLIPGVCPCPRARERIILLAPNLYITEMLSDYYLYTGDVELIREMLPVLERILKRFSEWEDADGLLIPPKKYWNFFDWSYELNHFGFSGQPTSLMNYFYLMALRHVIRLSRETGLAMDQRWMEERVERLPERIAARFYLSDRGLIADATDLSVTGGKFSQLAHALALLTDACTPELAATAKRALIDPELLMPEFYFHFFLFHALTQTGQAAEGLARIRKYWGDMVQTGTPTFWEAGIHGHGRSAYDGDGSLCHGFATAPLDFLQTIILGVKPLTPGFRTFAVAPQAFDLEFATGRIPTPAGNISISWRKNEGKLGVELTVPDGLEAQTAAGNFASGKHYFEL